MRVDVTESVNCFSLLQRHDTQHTGRVCETQHNNALASAIMVSVTFHLLLCECRYAARRGALIATQAAKVL
jgi:hypothetical protein